MFFLSGSSKKETQPSPPSSPDSSYQTDDESVRSAISLQSSRTDRENSDPKSRSRSDGYMLEFDYDDEPTDLYMYIQNKQWEDAMTVAQDYPEQIRSWVFRNEPESSSSRQKKKLRWRLLPIHATCIFKSSERLIELLLDNFPKGAEFPDDQGMLPLHLACRNGASRNVVKMLYEVYPDALEKKDRKSRTPLDLVEKSSNVNKDGIVLLLKRIAQNDPPKPTQSKRQPLVKDASSITFGQNEVGYEHRTTLFRQIMGKEWDKAISRCDKFSEEASTWIVTRGFNGNLRFLPLHKACVLQPPNRVVEVLIEAYPDGVQAKDQDGWLPIHCACFYRASEGLVNALLEANPKGAGVKDDEGRLPIHYACLKGAPIGVVQALLNAFPKGAQIKDDDGRLPIHHACSKGASDDIIEALLKVAPKTALTKDDQGRIALHHACRKNALAAVIEILMKVFVKGVTITDDQDKLPVHYACQHADAKPAIKMLLESNPQSILKKDSFGNTPLDYAKANGSKLIVSFLEKFQAEHNGSLSNDTPFDKARDKKIEDLGKKVSSLQNILRSFADAGKDMQRSVKNGQDMNSAVQKLSEALVAAGKNA